METGVQSTGRLLLMTPLHEKIHDIRYSVELFSLCYAYTRLIYSREAGKLKTVF